jgi:nitrate reductase NapA
MSASSKYNFAGITYDRLRVAHGLQWPCPTTDHPGTVRRFVGGEDPLVTPGRRIEFYGQPDKKAVVFARPYVPVPEQLSDEFPMTLTTGRVLEQWHTGTMTRVIPELAQATGPARFVIPAEDALRLDIATNDTIAVESRFGTTTGRAVIAPDAPGGIVFASFYDPKLMVNDACADHYDPYSKEPEYKITAVKVYKVGD